MAFLTPQGKGALVEAIQSIEAETSAEIVVSVKARSARYLEAAMAFAWLLALVVLAFLLFSPWEFALYHFLVDVVIAALCGGLLVVALPPLHRALMPAPLMAREVERAAAAAFFEQGVRLTAQRIGILVFVSVFERQLKVLADVGVTQAVPAETWAESVRALEDAVARGADAKRLAEELLKLKAVLTPALPRQEDDINELPDVVTQ